MTQRSKNKSNFKKGSVEMLLASSAENRRGLLWISAVTAD